MVDHVRGLKAGAVAGVLAGIILAIGYYAIFNFALTGAIRTAIQGNLAPGDTVDSAFAAAMLAVEVDVFLGTIVTGAIFGVIFAAVQDKFMKSRSAEVRGLVFGIVFWLLGVGFDVPYLYFGTGYFAASAVVGLVGSLTFGYLLGRFHGGSDPATKAPGMQTSTSGKTPTVV